MLSPFSPASYYPGGPYGPVAPADLPAQEARFLRGRLAAIRVEMDRIRDAAGPDGLGTVAWEACFRGLGGANLARRLRELEAEAEAEAPRP